MTFWENKPGLATHAQKNVLEYTVAYKNDTS